MEKENRFIVMRIKKLVWYDRIIISLNIGKKLTMLDMLLFFVYNYVNILNENKDIKAIINGKK